MSEYPRAWSDSPLELMVFIRFSHAVLLCAQGESCLRAVFQNTVAIFYMEIRRFDTLSFVEALQVFVALLE